jgi:hypothetical protein
VISLAPTAAEMIDEASLMARIGRPVPPRLPAQQDRRHRRDDAAADRESSDEPGSLFRPRRAGPCPGAKGTLEIAVAESGAARSCCTDQYPG